MKHSHLLFLLFLAAVAGCTASAEEKRPKKVVKISPPISQRKTPDKLAAANRKKAALEAKVEELKARLQKKVERAGPWDELVPNPVFDDNGLACFEIVAATEDRAEPEALDRATRLDIEKGVEWFKSKGLDMRKPSPSAINRLRNAVDEFYATQRKACETVTTKDAEQKTFRVEVHRRINETERNRRLAEVINSAPANYARWDVKKDGPLLNKVMESLDLLAKEAFIVWEVPTMGRSRDPERDLAKIPEFIKKRITPELRVVDDPEFLTLDSLDPKIRNQHAGRRQARYVAVTTKFSVLKQHDDVRYVLYDNNGPQILEPKAERRQDSVRTFLDYEATIVAVNPEIRDFDEQRFPIYQQVGDDEESVKDVALTFAEDYEPIDETYIVRLKLYNSGALAAWLESLRNKAIVLGRGRLAYLTRAGNTYSAWLSFDEGLFGETLTVWSSATEVITALASAEPDQLRAYAKWIDQTTYDQLRDTGRGEYDADRLPIDVPKDAEHEVDCSAKPRRGEPRAAKRAVYFRPIRPEGPTKAVVIRCEIADDGFLFLVDPSNRKAGTRLIGTYQK